MRRVVLFLILCASAYGQGILAPILAGNGITKAFSVSTTQIVSSGTCASSSTTCALTVTSTGAGHLLVVAFHGQTGDNGTIASVSGDSSWTLCPATQFNVTSTALASVSNTETLTYASNPGFAVNDQVYITGATPSALNGGPFTVTTVTGVHIIFTNSGSGTNTASVQGQANIGSCKSPFVSGRGTADYAYILSATGGATTITVTNAISPANAWGVVFYELAYSGGSISLDTEGTITNGSAVNPQPGVALTLTGVINDAIFTVGNLTATASISSPYAIDTSLLTTQRYAHVFNTVSGTAPNWSTTGTAATFASSAIAFKF